MTEQRSEADGEFESVLTYVKDSRGFDFTGYKRTSLMRRMRRRMSQVGIDDYAEYIDHLQANSDEFVALFNTVLINVTGFFRDPEAWDYLRTDLVPGLLAERGPQDAIRIWSAGCASGQEAYSLAILFAEHLGLDEFRRRVKIYATDVDDEALAQARHAVYTTSEIEGLDEDIVGRYFEKQAGRYVFRKDLRRSVIFGRNDLVQDAPISRIDLLVCRNTLMYFNAETQSKILERFHFALAQKGLLFLGKAEMLLSHAKIFEPFDLKRRVFRRTATSTTSFNRLVPAGLQSYRDTETTGLDELRDAALAASPVAQLVLTEDEVAALVNQQAEQAFGLSRRDIGRPFRDLDISYRPVALRGYVERARTERRSMRVKDVEWQRGGETEWYEIHVNPLVDKQSMPIGVSIAFHDVTSARQLLNELEHANQQLESAYEELQSTNEELETTNEELQSTVEELETTNEELQSTNEELETMNEELQSTNDELQTINNTLRDRTIELDEVNEFLESILTSIAPGIIVVDQEMRIRAWNRASEDLWGLRSEEAEGEHLLNLDIGLPLPELRPAVRSALSDPAYQAELSLEAVNRRGRHTTVRLLCGALRGQNGDSHGAILLMEQTERPTDRTGQ